MRNIWLIIAFIGIHISGLVAQEDIKFCKTPEVNTELVNNNPELLIQRQAYEQAVVDYIRNNPKDDQIYIVPVVFHVIHNYGPENISKAQIEDQIRIFNEDFRFQSSDTGLIIDAFKDIAADSKIEFRLAKLDPDGNCTDGITRTVSDVTYAGDESVKQIAPTWNREDVSYLNIWVVNRIPGAAGYSYYPYPNDLSYAGILITYSYVGSIEEGSASRSRTLTHEAGHFFDLAHPWGSTNDPEISTNCEIDDGIEDTPNTIGHTTCNLSAVSCGSLDNIQNYMDYTYCGRMFTWGQADKMHAALYSNENRNLLWQEDNLIRTGVMDPEAIAVCEPVSDFGQDKTIGCENIAIQFYDLSYNTDVIESWHWTFEGGEPAESFDQNPVINYPNAGNYDVSLTVGNTAGNNTKTRTEKISIFNPADALELPYTQDLEGSEFPNIPDSENNNFYFVDNGDRQWTRTSAAASSGEYSMRIENRYNDDNTINAFITPAFTIDTTDFPINIYFDIAYSKRNSLTNDVLKVYVSKDCGTSWIIQYYKSGNNLQTTESYTPAGAFIPTENEWKEESFSISPDVFWNDTSIRLKFETLSKGGHTLYVDNIRAVSMATNSINIPNISSKVYPNPFSQDLFIDNTSSQALSIQIHDISGRLIKNTNIPAGITSFNIGNLIPSKQTGLFFIRLTNSTGSTTIKVMKII
jgi:PKD repeat protein